MSFDPVRNVLPGLEIYPWVRRLREPSYATARDSRRCRVPVRKPTPLTARVLDSA